MDATVFDGIRGIELLVRESILFEFSPFDSPRFCVSCVFDGFRLQIIPANEMLEAALFEESDDPVAEGMFTLGFNPETEKPQIGWQKPPDDRLQVAVDVLVAVMILGVRQHVPAALLQRILPRLGAVL